MKKVYFACAITAGRDHADRYPAIVQCIKDVGAQVLSELFSDGNIDSSKGFSVKQDATPNDIWKWDLDWVQEADVIIAEVSQPSLGVGYEIGKAEGWGKPILALYKPQEGKRLTSMIVGNPNVTVAEYQDVSDLAKPIAEFLNN